MRAAIGIALAAVLAACSGGGDVGCDISLGPTTPMPDLEMHVGDTVETDLRDHFGPEGCVDLNADHESDIWDVESADPSAVAVAVSVSEAFLETVALEVADSVRVSVGLTDIMDHPDEDYSRGPPHEFVVRVRPWKSPPADR